MGKLPLLPHSQSVPLLLRLSLFPTEVEDRGCGFHCKVTKEFASENDRMMVDVREVWGGRGGGFLFTTLMSLIVHRSSWMTFCGGLMSSSPPCGASSGGSSLCSALGTAGLNYGMSGWNHWRASEVSAQTCLRYIFLIYLDICLRQSRLLLQS